MWVYTCKLYLYKTNAQCSVAFQYLLQSCFLLGCLTWDLKTIYPLVSPNVAVENHSFTVVHFPIKTYMYEYFPARHVWLPKGSKGSPFNVWTSTVSQFFTITVDGCEILRQLIGGKNHFLGFQPIQGGAGFRNHPQYFHNLPFILFNYLSSAQNPCVIPLNPGWFIGIPRSWVIAVPNILGRFG